MSLSVIKDYATEQKDSKLSNEFMIYKRFLFSSNKKIVIQDYLFMNFMKVNNQDRYLISNSLVRTFLFILMLINRNYGETDLKYGIYCF